MVLFYTNTPGDFVLHYGTFHSVLHYGSNRHVLHYGSNRHVLHYGGMGRPCPFVPVGVRHGTATLLPRKAKDGIFKAVVNRYFFLSGITWVKF